MNKYQVYQIMRNFEYKEAYWMSVGFFDFYKKI